MTILKILNYIFWLNLILSLIVIISERRNPRSTWMWIMVMLFLPVFGFVIYLWLGRDFKKSKIFVTKADQDQIKLSQNIEEISVANDNYATIPLLVNNSNARLYFNNEVTPLLTSKDYFKQLFQDIDNAKESIYIQTYIMKSDRMGKYLCERLVNKKSEGLDVKLLVDGMGSRLLKKKEIKYLKDNGVSVEIFFPFFISFISPRINYRNHRKMTIIDGRIGYIGGYNVGDEYFDGGKDFSSWRDSAVRIKGEVLKDFLKRFEVDFDFAANRNENYLPIKDMENTNFLPMQFASSGPDSIWPSIKFGYLKMINSAKKYINIETPYFIPDDSILEALKVACLSGVDVRILIPFKADHPGVLPASMSFLGELLKAGARVFKYKKGFQHSKLLSVDGKYVSMGTANMDIRSFILNFESNVFIYSDKITRQFDEKFEYDIKNNSIETTYFEYKNRSFLSKVKEGIFRLFAPIL